MEKLAYILPLASCAYLIVACWWVRAFFDGKAGRKAEAHNLADLDGSPPPFLPPVSVLKPVKGLDQGAYENFASFCRQDYPVFELLFAVADPADPVIPVIRQLQHDFPEVRVRLITEVPSVVANPKINSLLVLTKAAAHEILVVSDSDMRVAPDYLRRVVAPLANDNVGMVTCCYRGVSPTTLTAKLEALHMGVTFLPEVVVARR
ncbi:MAG: glycosyltransferase, partial [Thermoleophilia bacterium]|nr:glycosyltransferase [Thermoleophilia bacterium]